MSNLIGSVAVIDGNEPSQWTVFEKKSLEQFLKELGDISVISNSPLHKQKIEVKVLLDDVANWSGENVRAVTGIIIDGLQYDIKNDNPIFAKLEHVLGLLRDERSAYFRHFGLRILLMRPDRSNYPFHSRQIIKSAVATLGIDVGKITIYAVDSCEFAKRTLKSLADDMDAKSILFSRYKG
jgi:hypothetical protein